MVMCIFVPDESQVLYNMKPSLWGTAGSLGICLMLISPTQVVCLCTKGVGIVNNAFDLLLISR